LQGIARVRSGQAPAWPRARANTLPDVTAADTPESAAIAGSAARLVATAQALTDDGLHEASALPGWTRAHVLTHIAQAADSRTRLLRAAQAGRIGQQYPSEQARADAIDAGAGRPAGIIRADLDRAIQECLTAIREHPSQLWDAPGITLGAGRQPVRGVLPSMRRELEYHHVDLAAGYQPADWPADFVATELSQVTDRMDRRADAPPMTLAGHGVLHIGTSPPVDVTGPPAAMLAWLTGRSDGNGLDTASAALPTIPPLG
jgi:maleylpyruvate isomerase